MAIVFDKKYPITSSYKDHISRKPPSSNPGTDYGMPIGTPVYTTESGRVYPFVDQNGAVCFNLLRNDKRTMDQAVHLSKVIRGHGEYVNADKEKVLIGYSGNTGRSTGPHTHITKRIDSKNVDPEPEINNYYEELKMPNENKIKEALPLVQDQRPDVIRVYGKVNFYRWFRDYGFLEYPQWVAKITSHNRSLSNSLKIKEEVLQKALNDKSSISSQLDESKELLGVLQKEKEEWTKEKLAYVNEIINLKQKLNNSRAADSIFYKLSQWIRQRFFKE